MLQITPQMKILVAVEPADFRRGIDGLARLCQETLRHDPFAGAVFVFRNRKATALKVLMYDGQGFWLCHKRLSQGRFPWWPSAAEAGGGYPFGTVALYGPDDKTTTKIAAGVITSPTAEPIIRRWVATDVTTNPKVQREMKDFFAGHGVRSVAVSEGNMGCPHEEGEDFLEGTDCPFCPFWEGKQGSNRRD
jgi:transposase